MEKTNQSSPVITTRKRLYRIISDSQDIFYEDDAGKHSESLPDGQDILNGYEHNAGKHSNSFDHLIDCNRNYFVPSSR